MSHVRAQIRDRAVIVLTGLATTGINVFPSRQWPFNRDGSDLPALCVYTIDEEVRNDEDDFLSHIQTRHITLAVDGCAYAADFDTLDDSLDTIAAEVETAMFADQFLNGLAQGIDLLSSEVKLQDGAERPIGVITIIFRITYLTNEGAPEEAL